MTFNTSGTFNDVGFLSSDIQPIIAELRKIHANWFVFASDLNRTGQHILTKFKPSGSVAVRDVIAVALLMRTLSNFQGTVLMAERGMVAEAGTLARSCYEDAAMIGVLRKDGDKFLEEMNMSHQYSDKTMARWLVRVPERLEYAPIGAKRRLEERINEIKQQIPGFEPTDFKELFNRAGIPDAFVNYAILSRDAAHPSAQSLNRYLIRGSGEFPLQGMRWGAYASNVDEISLTLNMACLAALEVFENTCHILSDAENLTEVKAHRAVHDKLNGGKL